MQHYRFLVLTFFIIGTQTSTADAMLRLTAARSMAGQFNTTQTMTGLRLMSTKPQASQPLLSTPTTSKQALNNSIATALIAFYVAGSFAISGALIYFSEIDITSKNNALSCFPFPRMR